MTFNMFEDDLAVSPSNDTPDGKDKVHIRCNHLPRIEFRLLDLQDTCLVIAVALYHFHFRVGLQRIN
jgi:hypothetical protein